MHVGIVGGGLQGCCAALALAERGVRVTLFDKNPSLLSRAAVANEGKIHLGYMYAGDPTLSTARMMMTGALAFAPFLERCLGRPAHSFAVSAPAAYGLHRESQATAEKVGLHLAAVHALVNEAAASRKRAYFGMDLSAPLRPWSAAEREAEFDPEIATGAVSTPEIAINPTALAKTMREAVGASPLIESRCASEVVGLQDAPNGVRILSKQESASACERAEQAEHGCFKAHRLLRCQPAIPAGVACRAQPWPSARGRLRYPARAGETDGPASRWARPSCPSWCSSHRRSRPGSSPRHKAANGRTRPGARAAPSWRSSSPSSGCLCRSIRCPD